MGMPGRADVLSVLAQDHRAIQDIFARMTEAIGYDQLRSLTPVAIARLVRHEVAEELYLYPVTRKLVPGGDQIADRELAGHADAERTMRTLEGTDVVDQRFVPLLRRLILDVQAHFRQQESVLFPLLIEYIDPGELRDLGHSVRRLHHQDPPPPPPKGTGLVDHIRRRTIDNERAR